MTSADADTDRNLSHQFLTQTGRVGQELAVHLMALHEGDQLPTVAELTREFGVGGGTVQKAIDLLKSSGCVELQARGHLGTFIRSMDRLGLWRASRADVLVASMPLPYSRRYEGLATGLRAGWPTERLELLVSFARGSHQRLHALISGRVDFAVVSHFAAEAAIENGAELEIALELPEHTYTAGHCLLFSPGTEQQIAPGYSIGIDPTSADQHALTHLECSDVDVEFVEMGYMQLARSIATGDIDAAVWASDELLAPWPNVTKSPLRNPDAIEMASHMTSAAIVTGAGNAAARELLRAHLDVPDVVATQERVLNDEQLPDY